MTHETPAAWMDVSREVLMACDASGVIRFADDRAQRRLRAKPGGSLFMLVAPGLETKAKSLLERGRKGLVRDCELGVVVNERVQTYVFAAQPDGEGGLILLGSCMPEEHGQALQQVQQAMEELSSLNREIARQKRLVEQQKHQLEITCRELDESNRGVLSLHAELADKAETLQRTADVKSRVVANVSHEFRTPLHTILGLSQLLLDEVDGALAQEQRKQVQFIRASAKELGVMVDDMLDLSKAASGKVQLRLERLSAEDLLAALRGTLRPLLPSVHRVKLVFQAAPKDLIMETDPGKVSQILRNLVSNAIKFTAQGEVSVSVRQAGENVIFDVQDTGIGIKPEHFPTVFEEFGQIDSPLQRQARGTGLGLPLSRKLADLLGGSLEVQSEPGKGSTFTLTIPRVHPEVHELAELQSRLRKLKTFARRGAPTKVLVIDDDDRSRYVMQKLLAEENIQYIEAATGGDGVRIARQERPHLIFLDFVLGEETSFDVLDELKADPATRGIPVIVVTSHRLGEGQRQRLASETETVLSKGALARELAINNRIRDALIKAEPFARG